METVMTDRLDLPEPIAAYFAADRLDSQAVARCFTPDAVVKDEGHTYSGLAAITQWKAETSVNYTYTSQPFAVEQRGDMTVVTSRLMGNFPGSPIDLRFFFRLERGKIAFLEIIP
jgi:SnoaL-like protein